MYRIVYVTGELFRKHIHNSNEILESKTFAIKIKLLNSDYEIFKNYFKKFNRFIINLLESNIEFNNNINEIKSYLFNTKIVRNHEFIDDIESYDFFKDIDGRVNVYNTEHSIMYDITY